jgi:hypothetical protein
LPWKAFQIQLVKAISEKERGTSGDETVKIDHDYFDCWLTAVEETLKHEGIIAGDDVGRKIEEIGSSIAEIRANQLSQSHQVKKV